MFPIIVNVSIALSSLMNFLISEMIEEYVICTNKSKGSPKIGLPF